MADEEEGRTGSMTSDVLRDITPEVVDEEALPIREGSDK